MASQFLLRRSDVADKRPDPALMLTGALNLNYDDVSGGVFYKNSSGTLVKVGPAQVSATAPNATPAGEPGNSLGEFWYDTSVSLLKIWDGSAWQTAGETGNIPESIFTAKGDILTATAASTPVVLPVGTNGQILTVASGTATGLQWVDNVEPVYSGGLLSRAGFPNQYVAGDVGNEVNLTPDNLVLNDLGTLTYTGNGEFTNNTAQVRTYIFSSYVASQAYTAAPFPCFYTWYRKSGDTNYYGLQESRDQNGYTEALNTNSWAITLDPGDSVTFQTFVPAFGEIAWDTFAPVFGNDAGFGGKVAVVEVPTIADVGLADQTIEARVTNQAVGGGTSAVIEWDTIDLNDASSLTLSANNSVFTNNTGVPKTYYVAFQVGLVPVVPSTFGEFDIWLETSTGTRYAQQTQDSPTDSPDDRVLSTAGTIYLDPGESFSCNLFFTSSISGLAAELGDAWNSQANVVQIPAGFATQLKIVNLQTPQGLTAGNATYSLNQVAVTGGANTLVNWNNQGGTTITSLSYSNGVFTNIASEQRTYSINYQAGFDGAAVGEIDSWIQVNANTESGTNRYVQILQRSGDDFLRTASLVISLDPGETFSCWFFSAQSGNLSAGVFGQTAGSSTRIDIQDITAIPASAGTISGVIAGTNLNGGGLTGIVTLNLDSALTGITNISGAGLDIFGEGAAAPAGVTIFGGATTSSGAAGGTLLVSGGGGTGDCVGGTLTLRGGQGNDGTNSDGGNVVILAGEGKGTGVPGNVRIFNIAEASANATYTPTAATDLATKAYVDAVPDGTVTQVATGAGLTGGPITTTGTIALAAATTTDLGGVIPDGTTITVQPDGTITAVGGGGGTPAGSNTQIQYNDNGAFGASSNFTYDTTTNTIAATSSAGILNVDLNGNLVGDGVAINSTGGVTVTGGFASNITLQGNTSISGNDASTGGGVVAFGGDYIGASATGIAGGISLQGGAATNGAGLGGDIIIQGGESAAGSLGGLVRILAGSDENGANYNNVVLADAGGDVVLPTATRVKIFGGSNGQYLRTDGSGNLTWAAASAVVTIEDEGVSQGSASTINFTGHVNATVTAGVATVTLAAANYGAFASNTTQTNQDVTAANTVSFDTTFESNKVAIANGTEIQVDEAGVYNIQFSIQVEATAQGGDFELWFAKNGVDIADSSSIWTLANNDKLIASLNFVTTLAATDSIELKWYSAASSIQLTHRAAQAANPGVSPARPEIPSVILSVTEVH